jgi:hypothetical protein
MSLIANAKKMTEMKQDKHIKRSIITNALDNDPVNDINYTEIRIDRESINDFFRQDKKIDLDSILRDINAWHDFYQCCIYYMMYGVSDESMRYRTVIIYKSTDESFKPMRISVIKLTFNVVLFYALVKLDSTDIITNDTIVYKPYELTANYIRDFINKYVVYAEGVSKYDKCKIIDDTCYHFVSLANAFDDIIGIGLSIRTFYDVMKREPELRDALREPIDATLQPKEIEEQIASHVKKIAKALSESNNEIQTLFKSGNIISNGQVGEVSVAVGFKSDLDDNTIPVPSMNNIMITGLTNPSDKYIDSVGGRKAAINSKLGISKPGAISKMMNANAGDFTLRQNMEMCNTATFLNFEVKNEAYLRGIEGHWYYDENNELKTVRPTDTHLIGTVIKKRSPITCMCGGTETCRYCYPKILTESNSMYSSIGAISALVMGEPLGQMMLSTKHFNGTNSTYIKFTDDFYNDFEMNLSDIHLRQTDSDMTFIQIPEIIKGDPEDECAEYKCTFFNVLDKNMNLLYTVQEENGANIYLIGIMDSILRTHKPKDRLSLTVNIYDDGITETEEPLFMIEVVSAQVNDAANKVSKLLKTKDKCGCNTYEKLLYALIDTYLGAGLEMNFGHFEMMIRSLIRKDSNDFEYPDFTENGNPTDYRILSLAESLYRSPSPAISLRTSNLKRQLIDADLYGNNKIKPSHLDIFFAENPYDVLPAIFLSDEDTEESE